MPPDEPRVEVRKVETPEWMRRGLAAAADFRERALADLTPEVREAVEAAERAVERSVLGLPDDP